MSLKAVFKSHYFKAGTGKILTYLVQGTAAEIDEYKVIESARRNITIDKIACEGNFPIMFIAEAGMLRTGEMPKPSYMLIKNHNGTSYNRDTSADDMRTYQEAANFKVKAMGELLAKRALGIDIGDGAPRPQVATQRAQAQIPAVNTEVDDIAGAIAAGIGAEETGEDIPVVEEVGNENLGQ